jgi:hypothetical protein
VDHNASFFRDARSQTGLIILEKLVAFNVPQPSKYGSDLLHQIIIQDIAPSRRPGRALLFLVAAFESNVTKWRLFLVIETSS